MLFFIENLAIGGRAEIDGFVILSTKIKATNYFNHGILFGFLAFPVGAGLVPALLRFNPRPRTGEHS